MSRTVGTSVAGALVSFALICSASALAASPPSVFVRVEGAGATLLPQTLVRTTDAAKIKGNSCSGTSAAGALDLATAGNWSGTYSSQYGDYLVGAILGESPAGSNYWTLWINGRSSSTGACSTALHAGDHELWFDCIADPVTFNCSNNPLRLSAPAEVPLGRSANASVVQLDGARHSTSVSGAAISGAGVAAVSGSGGSVRFVPREAGLLTLQATKSGATSSDPVLICVYRRSRSECGSLLRGPRVTIAGIREHQVFTTGPRELQGLVRPDVAGLTDVELSLEGRVSAHRCYDLNADTGAWRHASCSAHAPRYSIGASASWSYLLPKALAAGGYRLVVLARDGNGRTGSVARDFTVKG